MAYDRAEELVDISSNQTVPVDKKKLLILLNEACQKSWHIYAPIAVKL